MLHLSLLIGILISLYGLWISDAVPQEQNQRVDIFALLAGTLRTYQKTGCDNDLVILKCPAGTSITVQIAQYGKSPSLKGLCNSKSKTDALIAKIPNTEDCLLPSEIQTVIESCQKKRQCKFKASPSPFGPDPCPGIPKYVEVAYKCKPYEFRSKVACENERVQLRCNPNFRVAIYRAVYGRTEYEGTECPQPQGVSDESCYATSSTETVMQLCHGKRNCDLTADISTFGSPCMPQSRTYLKIVYTCVPKHVLTPQYESPLEPDESDEYPLEENDEFDTYDSENEHIRESAASPPVSDNNNLAKNNSTEDGTKNNNSINEMEDAHNELKRRYILYLSISIGLVALFLLSFLVGRYLLQRYRVQKETKFYATSISDHTLANGFPDDVSELDNEGQHSQQLPHQIPSVTIHPPPLSSIDEIGIETLSLHTHAQLHSFPRQHQSQLQQQQQQQETEFIPARAIRDANVNQYYYG